MGQAAQKQKTSDPRRESIRAEKFVTPSGGTTDGLSFGDPRVGTPLTVAAGISFLFLSMLLPLVGPAGTVVPYADRNQMAFLVMLGVTFALGLAAFFSKRAYSRKTGAPRAIVPLALCGLCIAIAVALFAGLLKV